MSAIMILNGSEYFTPSRISLYTLTENKSVFHAMVYPVPDEQNAIKAIQKTKKRFADARHYPYAWVITGEGTREKFSDDGEPSGTAGGPLLTALKMSNTKNAVIVVVRYFGGILLGTGKLSRVYASVAKRVLHKSSLVMMRPYLSYDCICNYTDYKKIRRIFKSELYRIGFVRYGEQISFKAYCTQGNIQKETVNNFV
jgi:uncharacterized YigZ family protein